MLVSPLILLDQRGTAALFSQYSDLHAKLQPNMLVSGQSRMQSRCIECKHVCRQQQSRASPGTRTSRHTRTGMATMPMVPARALSCPQLLPAAALLAWRRPQGAARAPEERLRGHPHKALGQTGGTARTGGALQVSFDGRLAAERSLSSWSRRCLMHTSCSEPATHAMCHSVCLARA